LNTTFEIEQDSLLTEKILKTYVGLLKSENYIIIFNGHYLSKEIIQILNSKCIPTIIIFNNPLNLKETITNDTNNLILQTNNFFKLFDYKTLDEDWQRTAEIKIIKI
jgi:hypothetical protein